MIRPTSSANVAKGNMPHRQDHFPHGSAAIMRPTRFTGKMFPSILRLFALHNLLRQTHFPYTNVQQNRFASRVVHFTHRPRFADSIFPDKPDSRHAHMSIRRAASKSTPRALVMSIPPCLRPTRILRGFIQHILNSGLNTLFINFAHPAALLSNPRRALVRSITPLPSSNANTPRIHSTHSEQRIQRAIRLFLTHLLC